jgi:hypothetical protein
MNIFISPFNGECVCICGKHTKNVDDMVEHYRKDHFQLWYKHARKPSKYEREWYRP